MTNEVKQKSSFANLDTEQRQEMARLGGQAAHKAGKAHRFTPEEARTASMKGVATRRANAAKRAALAQQNREVQS